MTRATRNFIVVGAIVALLVACSRSPDVRARGKQSPATSRIDNAKPLVVLLRHSVWFNAVDRPLFILYDDGRVIFPLRREDGMPISYQTARVDIGDTASVFARLGIGPEFAELGQKYDLRSNVTDQETVFLYVWRRDSLQRVAVRSGFVGDTLSHQIPAAFREAYRGLTTFRGDRATPWNPDIIEVSAWPYQYAPDDPPLDWPTGWPDLNSPTAERRDDSFVKEIWTIQLAYDRRTTLEQLLMRRREKQAIRISGKKWAVGYRLPFPGEERWRRYFTDLES